MLAHRMLAPNEGLVPHAEASTPPPAKFGAYLRVLRIILMATRVYISIYTRYQVYVKTLKLRIKGKNCEFEDFVSRPHLCKLRMMIQFR